MKASIVITSFNRSRLLSFGLESLARQKFSQKDVEIIVLNDGNPDDNTEGICELFDDELNIRYFASRRPNKGWRVPGFAINYGVQQSRAPLLFISCAEMYHLGNSVMKMVSALETGGRILAIPASGKDDDGRFLAKIERGMMPSDREYEMLEPLHNIHLPFFIGMRKSEFMKIGGYDEDFTGVGFDDNDIVHRLQLTGHRYHKVDCKVVHLYHPRLAFHDPVIKQRFNYNNNLFYHKRSGNPVRNCNRKWGCSF